MRGEGVEVSLNFFPVSRKSDFFFMRLPVGSVVFVSHRLVCEGGLAMQIFPTKIFSDQREAGTIFFDETQFAEPKAPVATFAY